MQTLWDVPGEWVKSKDSLTFDTCNSGCVKPQQPGMGSMPRESGLGKVCGFSAFWSPCG